MNTAARPIISHSTHVTRLRADLQLLGHPQPDEAVDRILARSGKTNAGLAIAIAAEVAKIKDGGTRLDG